MKVRELVEKIFTILCVIFTILGMYSTKGLTWHAWSFLLLFPVFAAVLVRKGRINYERSMLFLCTYMIIYIIHAKIHNLNTMSIMQYIFYVILTAFFVPNLFLQKQGKQIYRAVCIFATVYIMIQTVVAECFGFYLSGALPIGGSAQSIYADMMNTGGFEILSNRPRSIFNEPSGYAIYVAVYMIILLWSDEKTEKRRYYEPIFLSVGLLVSRSSTGILLMILGWVFFFLREIPKKIVSKWWLIIGVIALSGMFFMLSTESFRIFIEHTFAKSGGTVGRVSGYAYAFDMTKYTLAELFFGHGVKYNGEIFLAGWPRIMYYFGIIGLMVFGLFLFIYWKRGNWQQKIIMFILALQTFFAAELYAVDFIWWWSLYFAYATSAEESHMEVIYET